MKISNKSLWWIFLIASLSPIIAMLLIPHGYSFYMFLPATPNNTINCYRFLSGNIFLVIGFIIALFCNVTLTIRGLRHKKYFALLYPIFILANPLQQTIIFEDLDSYMNYRWRDRAVQFNIKSKTPDEIRQFLGEPSYVQSWTETSKTTNNVDSIILKNKTHTIWNYHVLPFYFIGSKFQVFFIDGKVSGYEANDD